MFLLNPLVSLPDVAALRKTGGPVLQAENVAGVLPDVSQSAEKDWTETPPPPHIYICCLSLYTLQINMHVDLKKKKRKKDSKQQ